MPARVYRPPNQRVADKSQGLYDRGREIAEGILLPRIAERNKQALNVVPNYYHFYQKSSSGRRCSCWEGIETSPSSLCLVCFGTGNTRGYQLWGHIDEVFDVTARFDSVNVVIDYNNITRPLHFILMPGAKRGYVDFLLEVKPNIGVVSNASVHASIKRGAGCAVGVKLLRETEFSSFTRENIAARLAEATTGGGLQVRVVLSRESVSVESPRFSHARIRYQFVENDVIRGDVPRSTEANKSSEFGWFEEFASKNMFLDNTLREITTNDFFRDLRSNRIWKIQMVNPNAPGDQLLSWDVEVRAVMSTERLSFVP